MTTRVVNAAVALTLLAVGLVLGIALRPLVISETAAAGAELSAPEARFLQDMADHHQQAVTMSQTIDRDGIDPAIRSMARQIALTQQSELGTMTGWLRLAGLPIANPSPMAWMRTYPEVSGHHHASDAHVMPGMASIDELASLGELQGMAAENQFLVLMQRHHYGGIAMAQDIDAQLDEGLVKQLARAMINQQSSETGMMGALLRQRGISS